MLPGRNEGLMKRYKKVTKLTDNPFLNLYQMDALDKEQKEFNYYFASRNDTEKLKLAVQENVPEGVTIFAMTQEAQPRMVLIKEYRYPLDDYIYDLPAGLVEEGEEATAAAARELKEETGLSYTLFDTGSRIMENPAFMAPGTSDESNITTFGYVNGEASEAGCESTEDIQVVLADKKQVKIILEQEKISARAAYLMLLFLAVDPQEPFAFLKNCCQEDGYDTV